MEAVLTYIAVATVIGVPFVVFCIYMSLGRLIFADHPKTELAKSQIQWIQDKPLRVALWLGCISAFVMVFGLLLTENRVDLTVEIAAVWCGLIALIFLELHVLEGHIARAKGGDDIPMSGGGVG